MAHVLATQCTVKPLPHAHGFSVHIKVSCLHSSEFFCSSQGMQQ